MVTIVLRTLQKSFGALQYPAYRWLWLGRLATSATFHMGSVAQGWLVYELTDSAFALGWVGAGWSLATLLLSPYGGVIVDRIDKRGLMLAMRIGMLLNNVAVGLLLSLGMIQVWHLALSWFLTGVFGAFLLPAQQAMLSEVVPSHALMNAVSFDALGMGLMGILGASAAGLMIESVGAQSVYFVVAGMYLIASAATWPLPKAEPSAANANGVWSDIIEGARYLRSEPLLLALIALGLVRVFFVMPYTTLLPAFAQDRLGLHASGLGLLQSANGTGALLASLLACYLGDARGKGKMLVLSGVIVGLCLMLYVATPWLPSVLLFLVCIGGLSNLYLVLSSTLILSRAAPIYRGRVLSLTMMEYGLSPLGTLPAGAIADQVGVPWVTGVQGAIAAAVFGLVAILKPELRRMD
jgi:MFS family permease